MLYLFYYFLLVRGASRILPTSKTEFFTKMLTFRILCIKDSHLTCDRVPEFVFDNQITLDIFSLQSIFTELY